VTGLAGGRAPRGADARVLALRPRAVSPAAGRSERLRRRGRRLRHPTEGSKKKFVRVSISRRLVRRVIGTPKEDPVKYLTFIRSSESYRAQQPPPALMEAMGKFVEKSFKDGTLVDTGGLLPSKDGFRLRLTDGKMTVTDGPFAESKEVIGGWAILKAESRAEALRVATEFMELHRKHWPEFDCESEVRPMFEPGAGP
jgi:hypothetical protein